MGNDIARRKLLDAAIGCIGTHGLQAVTNRLIAKAANMNCAAINYHFGSKENLINEAVRFSVDQYLSDFFDSPGNQPAALSPAVLKRFLSESLKDMLQHPHLTKSYLYDAFMHADYRGVFIERLNLFLNRLPGPTGKMLETQKFAIAQMVSAVLFIGLMPDFYKSFLNVNLREAGAQKKYIATLLEHFGQQ